MILKKLVENLTPSEVKGCLDIDIKDIAYDSRKVRKGSVFVCIEGTKQDGHDFIEDAIRNGAAAVVAARPVELPGDITLIISADGRSNLAAISDTFFSHPSGKIKLIGITGTKGKTTVTYMIKSILEAAGEKVGLIGTNQNMIGSDVLYAERTTPESYDLQSLLALMVEKGADSVVMEVSSQGLALHRVDGCEYHTGVFTNLSRDHIGPMEHKSMDDYFNAKLKLFEKCRFGLVNADNEFGRKALSSIKCPQVLKYGIEYKADIKADNIIKRPGSVEFDIASPWWAGRLSAGIPGTFSVYNALAAAGAAGICGVPLNFIREGIKEIRVSGRVEVVESDPELTVIVDYAHTPDSLQNILSTVKENTMKRLVCVFGCGGDRDKAKRPIMGGISGAISDFTVITSDNPRTEIPEDIVRQIEEGVKESGGKYVAIVDRKEAIRFAIMNAMPGDTIVIAGKGHETYQQFKDSTIHFDDREVAREILNERKGKGA